MINRGNQKFWLVSFAVCAICAFNGQQLNKIFREKISAQNQVTESVHRWTDSFNALNASIKRWDATFKKESSIQDLRGLIALANFDAAGLGVSVDGLSIASVEPVLRNGAPIGLTMMCLASQGAGDVRSVEVNAKDYKSLFEGIRSITGRSDISVSSINIRGDRKAPTAILGNFCVLLAGN